MKTTLNQLAAEYSKGLRAYYTKNPFGGSNIDVAVIYGTQDWLNQVRGWAIETIADDVEYWKEKWAKANA